MEREAREAKERRALQATQEPQEQRREDEQEHEYGEEQQRKRTKSITGCKPARLDNRGWALARALRARARPFEVGASRSLKARILRGFRGSQALKPSVIGCGFRCSEARAKSLYFTCFQGLQSVQTMHFTYF